MLDSKQEQTSQEWDYYANMPVGEILRRARTHYGLTLQQVEAILCIRTSFLEALENGDMDSLPGRTYAIGFIRTYAEYLRLDGDKIVKLFKAQSVGNVMKPELYYPSTASESKLPNKYVLAASAGALVMLILFLSVSGVLGIKKDRFVPVVPEDLKIELASSMEVVLPLEAAMLNSIEPAAGVATREMVINVKESAWLEVRDVNGKALISKVLSEGDSYRLPQEEGLVLDTGNAGALEIVWGDTILPALGESGDIIRNIVLDPVALQKVESFSEEENVTVGE